MTNKSIIINGWACTERLWLGLGEEWLEGSLIIDPSKLSRQSPIEDLENILPEKDETGETWIAFSQGALFVLEHIKSLKKLRPIKKLLLLSPCLSFTNEADGLGQWGLRTLQTMRLQIQRHPHKVLENFYARASGNDLSLAVPRELDPKNLIAGLDYLASINIQDLKNEDFDGIDVRLAFSSSDPVIASEKSRVFLEAYPFNYTEYKSDSHWLPLLLDEPICQWLGTSL